MKRIFTLFISAFLCTMVMGQAPTKTALLKKATIAPIIDGKVDAVWTTAQENAIAVPLIKDGVAEVPTVGNSWWKGLWDEKGIYVLCFVDDNVFVPAYMGTKPSESWNYDKLEIYFNCNYNKKDGGGGWSAGHYQFAPTETAAYINGGKDSLDLKGFHYSFNASETPKYYVEYFFPFSILLDNAGMMVDYTSAISFDISIQDNDILEVKRDRMNWSNTGESNNNMDDNGLITLEDASIIIVDAITIKNGAITTDNGTFQVVPVITPTDATVQTMKYSIIPGGTGIATISATGLVTAIRNGTVNIRAEAMDGAGGTSNDAVVTISGQILTLEKINLFKNGNFDKGANGLESWGVTGNVVESWLTVECTPKTPNSYIWDTMIAQGVKVADATTKYIVKFKAKASVDMIVPFVIEDTKNSYNKVVTSESPLRGADYFNIPVTTVAKWFEFDVIHSAFVENSTYQPSFQLGKNTGTFSVDSIGMYSVADLALIGTSAKSISASSMKVYPNPVGADNQLYVNTASVNAKVAIYNALGQKMMEKVSTGNLAKFDVSSLTKGMYFVRLSDGTSQKFIK